jgi:hypothetical protein
MRKNPILTKLQFIPSVACVLVGLAASVAPARGQIFVHPNTLTGTLRFTNTNPAILDLLASPGDEGMSNLVVLASSVPPAPYISASSDLLTATNRLVTSYQMTVESASPGIAYAVSPTVILQGQLFSYYFNSITSAPVTIGVTPPALDFSECVGVVTVQFVTPGGAPVSIDGGQMICYDTATFAYSGIRSDIPAGVTEQRIYLRGGSTHQLDITVHRGTNFYSDRIESFLSTNVAVTCDQFTTIKMTLPDVTSLATITGRVKMEREFEDSISATTSVPSPDYTSVVARFGPYANERWAGLPGLNFLIPSSGTFTLSNVVPTTIDPLFGPGYELYAQMAIRTNRMIELFLTPALGSGANPALAVPAGSSIDLSNTFDINPGYARGRVLLQGPAESAGHPSQFRGLYHAGDDDVDFDGIPDFFGTYGVYWSVVEAVGVDRPAPGATGTASGGIGETDFGGDFNPLSRAYEGQYELALGGLHGEASVWQVKYLTLTTVNTVVTNDDDYYDNIFSITDQRTNDVEVFPNQPVTNDLGYCFSEVRIVFRSTSDAFYSPAVRFSPGAFAGTDFQGQPADYTVDLEAMVGTPTSSATASNIGQVTMFLPQATYTLYPSVTPVGENYASTGLEPIEITVGCRQRLSLEPCLQLILDAPSCTNTSSAAISGSVRSCTNEVTSISYTVNGGPSQTICNDCGINPDFAFGLALSGECLDNELTVVATDASGGVSSVATTVRYDPAAPVITCPSNVVATACDTNGAVVNFNVTATDNCTGPVTITCVPPSGSVFPVGVTTVTCTAADPCGNSSQCTFTVTVGGSLLTIEPAVIVRWECGGTLQSADSPLGPWSDVPGAISPYATPTSGTQRYFRVRN